jgi:hypothetical protein
LATGTTAIVLSDGNYLYILTQAGTGTFFANNGTAAAPSYTFNSDNTSGMFLASTAQLGLSAGGVDMLLINNSNPLSPQVVTPATLTAANYVNVSGGTF